MSQIVIQNLKIEYDEAGVGENVVLLHGWGQNKEMMSAIFEHLKENYHVVNIDLPGFGQSEEPKEPWGVPDYEALVIDFLDALSIEQFSIVAHSFGCRIAFHIAYDYPERVTKMCLTGAAGIKPKKSIQAQAKTGMYKAGKWFLTKTGQEEKLAELQNKSGSEDYRNASGVMRGTFVKIVNDDVSDFLDKINCETLLVWGDKDDAVPLSMAKKMEETMPNAGLAIFEGDDHFAYWHQADRFNRVLDIFLKGNR